MKSFFYHDKGRDGVLNVLLILLSAILLGAFTLFPSPAKAFNQGIGMGTVEQLIDENAQDVEITGGSISGLTSLGVGKSDGTAGGNTTIYATRTSIFTYDAANWNEDGVTWTMTGTGPLVHVTGNTTTVTATTTEAIVAGTTYRVTITGTGAGGTASYTLGGVTGTTIAASGAIAIEDFITASTTGALIITPASACTVSITSVAVEKLTDATGDLTVDGNLIVRSPAYFSSSVLAGRSGVSSNPDYSFLLDSNTGIAGIYPDQIDFILGGVSRIRFNGAIQLLGNLDPIQFGSANDVQLNRDAANVLSQRRTTNQQTFRIYNTGDAVGTLTNYERLALTGVQGASVNLTAETAGTGGDNLDIVLTPAGTGIVKTGKAMLSNQTKTISTTPVTLTANEIANATIFVTTGASVINLPAGSAALDGAKVTFRSIAAVVFSIDPNGTQIIDLAGTDLAGGNKITSDGTSGAAIKLIWDNTGTKWRTIDANRLFIDGGA